MQLIRAINKSNKSNNNNNNGSANQTSSTSNNNSSTNKVVIVAPPPRQQQQQQSVSQNANNNNSSVVPQPSSSSSQPSSSSPSVSLPPLKKRTTIVKQAVPPPPPPRKSSPAPPARSKSNNHKSSSYCTSRIIVNVDRLQCLSEMTVQSGNLKVKKWLESVELNNNNNDKSIDETSIPEEVPFEGVKKLIESFTIKSNSDKRKIFPAGRRKVSDSSLVKSRVEGYNTLEKKVRNQSVNMLKSETDSGIEISSKPTSLLKFHHQFSRDGEFV
jgi:hypothetical protein